MKRNIFILTVMALFLAVGIVNVEAKEKKEKAAPEAAAKKEKAKKVTVTGEVSKVKKAYKLATEDGNTLSLPMIKKGKDGKEPEIKLEDFVGKKVTVVGMGTSTKITRITTITETEEAPAENVE